MTSAFNKLNNLKQRILAGVLGALIIVGSTLLGEWSYAVVFALICIFSQLEFYKLVGLDGMLPLKSFGTFVGFMIFSLTFLVEHEMVPARSYFLILPFWSMIFLIKLYKKTEKKPFNNIAITFLCIIYVAVPFALLNVLVFYGGSYSYQIIVGCLLILWASDTGAYFAGVQFGKRKLFERVSPKKSWEGSLGGAVLAFAMGFVISRYFVIIENWQWAVITGIIVVAGTYGDLVESLFKRSIAIKDSGSSIPGHGGFLDRFDGLLISTPFITAFLKIF